MSNVNKNKVLRYLFLAFILAMIVYFLGRNLAEIRQSFDTTVSSLTGTIFLAILVLAASQMLYVIAYRMAFSNERMKYRFWEMFKLQLSAQGVNMIVPSAGLAGILIFADDAKEKGQSRAVAVTGSLTSIISEFSALSILLLASMTYLFLVKSLGASIYLPTAIFISLTLFYYYLLFAAGNPNGTAHRIVSAGLKLGEWFAGKIFKKKFRGEKVLNQLSTELSGTSQMIKDNPRFLIGIIGVQLVVNFLRLVALFMIFYSLGYRISPNVLLAGYSIGVVLTVVSPTPAGVGFVEGGMYLMYTSLSVPGAVASTATIIYRFLQFWLPTFVGLVLLQQNRIKKIKTEVKELDNEG